MSFILSLSLADMTSPIDSTPHFFEFCFRLGFADRVSTHHNFSIFSKFSSLKMMIQRPPIDFSTFAWCDFPIIQEQLISYPSTFTYNRDATEKNSKIPIKKTHVSLESEICKLPSIVIMHPEYCEPSSFAWSDFPIIHEFLDQSYAE